MNTVTSTNDDKKNTREGLLVNEPTASLHSFHINPILFPVKSALAFFQNRFAINSVLFIDIPSLRHKEPNYGPFRIFFF